MQTNYDIWEPDAFLDQWQPDGGAKMAFEDPSSFGLVDIGKGKSKGGGKFGYDSWDSGGKFSYDSWDNSWDDGFSSTGEVQRQAALGTASFKSPSIDSKGKGGGSWRSPLESTLPKGLGGLSGKAPPGSGAFVPDPNSKGTPGFSYKGKLAPRKAPPSSVPVPPPSSLGKGGLGQTGPGPTRPPVSQLAAPILNLDLPRGPVRPPMATPRQVFRAEAPKALGATPRVPLGLTALTSGTTVRPPGSTMPGPCGLSTALPAGPRSSLLPPTRYVPPTRAALPLLGATSSPPPPLGPMPALSTPLAASLPKLYPALPPVPAQSGPAGLAPELAALVSAEGDHDIISARLGPVIPEKKPRIYLLVTRLAPELDEGQLQQIMEQCGEVQAFRRGRDADGKPLSFGFAQFGDPEAAWKASTCLSKQVICGQEIKVLVEENAETLIQQWRRSQQATLRVSTDEELDWELERKAVSCKASIDAKIEELFGVEEDGSGGSAIAQRRQELRERERKRIERLQKRKAWREEEFARELERVESAEKRLRRDEIQKDDADRAREEAEQNQKEAGGQDQDLPLPSLEDAPSGARPKGSAPDNRKLVDMVDIVQAESRDDLFRLELNLGFLRGEKILEKKLRPWLERKVDLCMGGPQSDLVEYILRRVNASSMPDTLISELTRYLDDNAEPLVERMWRMLAFELMRGGFAFTNSSKKREGGQ